MFPHTHTKEYLEYLNFWPNIIDHIIICWSETTLLVNIAEDELKNIFIEVQNLKEIWQTKKPKFKQVYKHINSHMSIQINVKIHRSEITLEDKLTKGSFIAVKKIKYITDI